MRTLAVILYALALVFDLAGAALVIAEVTTAQRTLRRFVDAGTSTGEGTSYGQLAMSGDVTRTLLGSGRRRGIGAALLIIGAVTGAAGNFCALAA